MRIRVAERSDHPRLLELWVALMRNGAEADSRYALAEDAIEVMSAHTWDTWFEVQPFPRVLVWCDPEPQAFVHGFPLARLPVLDLPPTARIGDLYVDPAARRRGVGRALVDAWVRGAADAGFSRTEVGTLVQDERAVKFWSSLGYSALQVIFDREERGPDGRVQTMGLESGINAAHPQRETLPCDS